MSRSSRTHCGFCRLSRNKTVVTAWSGSIDGEHMVYATPDHPEYKRYSLRDFLVVNPEAVA
ncbi:MAG: BREX-3 system P-loop-containing protein BrxF [Bacillota bacterium]